MIEDIYNSQNGFCCVGNCYEEITEFHHLVHNTKVNRKKYPLFIDSPMNLRGTCQKHHAEWTMHSELKGEYINKLALCYENYLKQRVGT